MKRIWLLVATSILLFVLMSQSVYAHSGRTDSSGGHNCSEKSKAKGLCTGYHYHNGGTSSGGSSEGSSDTSSGSTSTTTTSTPVQQVDENQVKADTILAQAQELYAQGDFENTLVELEKLYPLERNISKADTLVAQSLQGVYNKADEAYRAKDYNTAKSKLTYIKDYARVSADLKSNAQKLLDQIKANEEYTAALSTIDQAITDKKYSNAFSEIEKTKKVKDSEEIQSLHQKALTALMADADKTYSDEEYEKSQKYHEILVPLLEGNEAKEKYNLNLKQIKSRLVLIEHFDINKFNSDGVSLYDHLVILEQETPYTESVVETIKDVIVEDAKEKLDFIFNFNIKDLFKGSVKNAS